MTPSRRNTTRSAQAACRASWVTSTPAAPASTRARSSRRTASPVCESSAPVGSSASTSRRCADERPGDRDPLLLPAGHLVGEAVGVRRSSSTSARAASAGAPGLAHADAVQLQRQRHVLGRGEAGQQVEVLEHVADPAPAQRGERPAVQAAQDGALDERPRPGRRVEPAGEVEQRRLAGARTAP